MATDHWKNEFERVAEEARHLRKVLDTVDKAHSGTICRWFKAEVKIAELQDKLNRRDPKCLTCQNDLCQREDWSQESDHDD